MKSLIFSIILITTLGLLLIPSGSAAAQSGCTQTHTVQTGENLYRIGLRYGVSWITLAQWNNLSNANLVYIGQVLCVSGPSPTTPTTPGTGGPVVVRPGNPFGPTTEPRAYFPAVTLGTSFELRGYNFPPNSQVTIGLTTLGNQPYTPYYTATTSATGEFYVLINIPSSLVNASTIAVEARTASGYYARNWFYNR